MKKKIQMYIFNQNYVTLFFKKKNIQFQLKNKKIIHFNCLT